MTRPIGPLMVRPKLIGSVATDDEEIDLDSGRVGGGERIGAEPRDHRVGDARRVGLVEAALLGDQLGRDGAGKPAGSLP